MQVAEVSWPSKVKKPGCRYPEVLNSRSSELLAGPLALSKNISWGNWSHEGLVSQEIDLEGDWFSRKGVSIGKLLQLSAQRSQTYAEVVTVIRTEHGEPDLTSHFGDLFGANEVLTERASKVS